MEVLEKPLAAGNVAEVARRVEYLKTAVDPHAWLARWNELGNADDPNWGLDVETDADGTVTARYDDYGRLILEDQQYSPALVDNSREVFDFLKDQGRYSVLAKNAQTAIDHVCYGDKKLFREIVAYVDGLAGKPKPKRVEPSEHRLSDCLTTWQEWKFAKVGKEHYRAYTAIFNRFIDLVGNHPLNRLTKDHLLKYEKHINDSRGERSAKWTKDQMVPLAAILKLAMKKTSWDFPPGLREWIEFEPGDAYKPSRENRQPMPVEVFKALLSKSGEWSKILPCRCCCPLLHSGCEQGISRF